MQGSYGLLKVLILILYFYGLKIVLNLSKFTLEVLKGVKLC